MFRLAVLIDEPIHVETLQRAYELMLERCPYFRVQLRRGLFWYYLEENPSPARVEAESTYPCLYIPYKRRGVLPFRLMAYKNKIIFEAAHFITDGYGALRFLQGITAAYLSMRGFPVTFSHDIIDHRLEADPAEFEDSFMRHFDRRIPRAAAGSRAFQLPGRSERSQIMHVYEAVTDSSALKRISHEYAVTIGEFLTALLIDVCLEYMQVNGLKRMPVRISIPINLRKFFPSKTLRNFVLTVEPGIDPRLGDFSFEDTIKNVHHFMKLELDHRYIGRQISRNVGSEKHPLIRIIPLWLKDPILKRFYETKGSRTFTMSFSNLGLVSLPEDVASHVDHFQFIAPPHKKTISATAISCNGKTSIILSSTFKDITIERSFFRRLRKMGIHTTLMTNRS